MVLLVVLLPVRLRLRLGINALPKMRSRVLAGRALTGHQCAFRHITVAQTKSDHPTPTARTATFSH